MKKIGMLVAVEMEAVFSRYGRETKILEYPGYSIYVYENPDYTIYALSSGAGEIASSAGTQFLITALGVDFVVNFGVAGGLTPEMALAKLCVVEKVVHYDLDTRAWLGNAIGQYPGYPDCYIPADSALVDKACALFPELRRVICASADKFVEEAEDKSRLHREFGAELCEMEAAGILLTCRRNGVPCLLIKAVSDSLLGGAEEFLSALKHTAELALDVADRIIKEL